MVFVTLPTPSISRRTVSPTRSRNWARSMPAPPGSVPEPKNSPGNSLVAREACASASASVNCQSRPAARHSLTTSPLSTTRPASSLCRMGRISSAETTVEEMLLAKHLECCGPKPL